MKAKTDTRLFDAYEENKVKEKGPSNLLIAWSSSFTLHQQDFLTKSHIKEAFFSTLLKSSFYVFYYGYFQNQELLQNLLLAFLVSR